MMQCGRMIGLAQVSRCGVKSCSALCSALFVLFLMAENVSGTPQEGPSLVLDKIQGTATAALVAVRGGWSLRKWSDYASTLGANFPVWILCRNETSFAGMPHVRPFVVRENASWASAFSEFAALNPQAAVFGFLGEGVLPHRSFDQEVVQVEEALAISDTPTAVLSRSRSMGNGTDVGDEIWLPDTFIAQAWLNRRMLEQQQSFVLDQAVGMDFKLLHALPQLLQNGILVDGTNVLSTMFAVSADQAPPFAGNGAAADGGDLYIGGLDLALVQEDDGSVEIVTAPWPPRYVLETVKNDDGLVIVNNVNCGYLDFATNFLRSVRRVSDAKVLWVTMDEVAFEYMDALAPGCAAMFPSEDSQRHHAIKAGVIGDATFQAEVLVRPNILQAILAQGYTVLWTDSDMVWLGNPLPLLPDISDPSAAEVMLQHDGNPGNKCTCFMFIEPTDVGKELLVLWKQSIVDSNAFEDQRAFRPALVHQQDAGMRLAIFPVEKFPAGKDFFDRPYEEGFAQLYHSETLIVHNNWIKGHEDKLRRFLEYHLWDVEGVSFPNCSV